MQRRSTFWRGLATGAVTLGWLQGLELVNFAELFTQFLAQFFSALVAGLFGGDLSPMV